MTSDFAVYCIKSVSSPPQALSRRKDSGEFYCHVEVPVPEQLVVFSEGDWAGRRDYDVMLSYKDDEIQLGQISRTNSCLCWRRDASIPATMMSETEKGVAKLVLEHGSGAGSGPESGPPLLEKMTPGLQEGAGNTQQVTDDKSCPSKGQKYKRKSSLGRESKTPNEPSTKKQKVQNSKPATRVRTPKSDSQNSSDTQQTKEDPALKKLSDKKEKDSASKETLEEKTTKTEASTAKKSKKGSKAEAKDENKEQAKDKIKADTTVKGKDDVKDKKAKKDKIDVKQEKAEISSGKEKKNKKDSKIEVKGSPKETQADKKIRKSSRTESKPKLEPKPENDENSRDSGTDSANVDSDTSQEKRRGRKSKKEQAKENTYEGDKCDKENLDSNIPAIPAEVQKQILALSNTNKPTQTVETKGTETSCNGGKKKMAMCKDLTSRALARPTGRWGHSLCFIHKNMSVLVGGQGEKQQLNKDAVWTLDTETRRWKSATTQSEGQKPENRMGHTATYDPMVRCIYVFGGSKNTRWFHDVHVLDIDEWKWQLVKVNGKAPTRAYHSATLYRHELWIFGGVYPRPDPQPDGCSNDIHIFSPVMESWYSPIVKGEKPVPRSGHSATLLNDQLVVFGGWDAPISYSDLHILDMSIVEWTQPEFKGTPPSPRSWHASCALTGNRLLIHGGYNGDFALDDTHVFNLDDMTWTQIQVDGPPTARVGHKAVCMPYRHDNEEEDEVIIFGGGDNDGEYFDDLMSIYVPFDPLPVTAVASS